MSLKGTNNTTSDGARKMSVPERLDKYLEDGTISTESYEELIEKYGAVPNEETKNKRENVLINGTRNVLAILIGLIIYVLTETLTTYIFLLLLKIPILSFLMTGYIPADIFLSASVASSATFATAYIVRLISSYKAINYSAIIVFSTLLITYIVAFIYKVSTIGFSFVNLTSTLIFVGSYIVGYFTATEKI